MQNDRRLFVRWLVVGTAAVTAPRIWAEALVPTPPQTEGPFYPDRLPLDTDNDLIIVSDRVTPALGDVTNLTGRIVDVRGQPVKDALIEIWQADANGVYLHSADTHAKRDANFQGYGRFETNAAGEYRFRTIKPVPYPGRAPHIHVKVSAKGRELLTTQLYIQGHPQNEHDGVFRSIDPKARAAVLVPFVSAKTMNKATFMARFDIVLGATPVS